MLACAIGNLLIIELILKNKLTKPKEEDLKGFNCLYYATYYGHLDVVKHLKNIGVPYTKSSNGTTCLHVAVRRNYPDLVDFFLTKLKDADFETFQLQTIESKSASPPPNPRDVLKQREEAFKRAREWEKEIDVDDKKG